MGYEAPSSVPEIQEEDYRVGYAKPPRHSRFKPGMSGNPRGRAKGRKSTAQLVDDLLVERITLTVNGKRKRLPLDEVVLRGLINKAVNGDVRSIRLLDELRGRDGDAAADHSSVNDSEDEALIAAALARRAELQGGAI